MALMAVWLLSHVAGVYAVEAGKRPNLVEENIEIPIADGPCGLQQRPAGWAFHRSADWKSATPRVGNLLRYTWAVRRVAQTSSLLYRRLPVGRPCASRGGGGLEIRDTAGWKPVQGAESSELEAALAALTW